MRRRVLPVLALLLLLAASGTADDGEPEDAIQAALAEALEHLSLAPEAVTVRDVHFWKGREASFRERTVLHEDCPIPLATDPLRHAAIDEVLRAPLDAVHWATQLRRTREAWFPAHDPVLGAALGEGPPSAPSGEHPLISVWARLLGNLEDTARLPDATPAVQKQMTRWLLEGIPSTEIPAARSMFDAIREAGYDHLQAVAAAPVLLLRAAGLAAPFTAAPQPETVRRVETPRGAILVGTSGDDVYEGLDGVWLIIDAAGNDTYRSPTPMILDLQGDDRYESTEDFTFGSALFGVSVLVDLAGDDHYAGGDFCQGAAVGGLGILIDAAGNDRYEARRFAQGAAFLGRGLLWDREGADTYTLAMYGQGFGRTGGIGLLRDDRGNDRYVAGGVYESFYSQWTGGHTVTWSWAQGCGLGFYGRYEEEIQPGKKGLRIRGMFPGGVGLLSDRTGDDAYEGSMWAQGTGYFQALGVLHDSAGNDTYKSEWYGQGASAHFGAGVLMDGAGDDLYDGLRQAQANGRDFSTAVLVDLAGNDTYSAQERAQGCGDVRDGYGIFVDVAGDDRYAAKQASCRGFATQKDLVVTSEMPYADLGIFLDLGGTDTYTGKAGGADGTVWVQESTGRGVGIDR